MSNTKNNVSLIGGAPMSDGPHRSLPMRRKWKVLSERADRPAFSAEQVTEAVCPALASDWLQDISQTMVRLLRNVLGGDELTLFPGDIARQVEDLRSRSTSPLETLLVEAASDAVNDGLRGQEALERAAADTLRERAIRGILQVEEHWRREVREQRVSNVRDRLEASVASAPISSLALTLINGESTRGIAAPKRGNLDDGVPLEP